MMKPSTERDYRRRIARVVEAILLEPGARHTLDSLAAVAHMSPYHFHRIYRALMGESVVDTVKRLRLAEAAQRLTDAAQVTAVAHDAGYDSPQAFARAFRDFTGVSPSEFRTRQRHLVANPVALAASSRTRRTAQARNAQHGAGNGIGIDDDADAKRNESAASESTPALPSVEVAEFAPLDVLCLRHDGPVATIGQTFHTLMTTLRSDGNPLLQQRVGICARDPSMAGGFCYRAGIVAGSQAAFSAAMERLDESAQRSRVAGPPPPGIEPLRLEGGLYAVHRLVGPYALISPTFRALYSGWLPRSGYRRDQRPGLELYRSAPDRGALHPCVTDLLIPIRED
ncbi:AraC family transcriptional regulator [Paraburkholderia sp. UYCP14C]|uniref:AraC family transcriptional regulator n=1 Tax=Paraburkholderia sp. UYCP14C TaxID=2511130 RepID=UPI00101ED675|nr:GyrI-like domain-containing protein [Paraburkholderia sp. UYCP14C]RZF29284.1 AraC family transcriptional regulator [Paraburkholderia sp. UYCP14C]